MLIETLLECIQGSRGHKSGDREYTKLFCKKADSKDRERSWSVLEWHREQQSFLFVSLFNKMREIMMLCTFMELSSKEGIFDYVSKKFG